MIYVAVILLVACVVLGVLFFTQQRRVVDLSAKNGDLESQNVDLSTESVDLRTQNAILRERCDMISQSVVAQREQIEIERVRINETIEKERLQLTAQFTDRFQTLANDILEAKSKSMTETNSKGMETILKPLGEQLERFRQRIEEESKQRFALQSEVKRLAELNLIITQEANNLTSALKGNSKIQGDWGEMILETLLESSGLVKGTHFFIQETIKNEDGANLRPDVILHLPDNKEVVIDSKVSLTDYVGYCNGESESQMSVALSKHLSSVRKHIDELGVKNYHKLINSPDFVIMFVPNEPAFLLALQNDESLWQYAYKKGVILSSPTNLFSILKIVEDLWRRDSQSKNAIEIAKVGGELYDKVALFVRNFEDLGKSIEKSSQLFGQTHGQLSVGKGNILGRAEKMKRMGATTTKQISTSLLDSIDSDDND